MNMKYGKLLLLVCILSVIFSSCYKKDIQFGTDLGETYTNLLQIDTVGVEMSTVLLDSFETTAPSSFLLGRYKDEVFGVVAARPFFQIGLPSDVTMETGAVYDSLVFFCKTNQYYYGDTTQSMTISVNELSENLEYSYSDEFYNTTSIAQKPVPLGTKTLNVRPVKDTMITIRLNDAKGLELFNKLVQKSDEIQSSDAFIAYFKGIALGLGSNDNAVIYGLKTATDAIAIRLYYHTTTPYQEEHYKDFTFLSNNKFFNQVLTDRSNTLLGGNDLKFIEIPASKTNNLAFSQTSTGTLLKMTFPTLRELLKISSNVQLLNASIVLRVAEGSYNTGTRNLPDSFYLAQTDGSNAIGSYVIDASGTSILYAAPQMDHIYNTNATYTFDVTAYIKKILSTPGSSDKGFFLLENSPKEGAQVNRAIINAARNGSTSSQLILSVLTVKN
ncbi:DUF4270 domain-containing protein [Chitinophagaceae bacterium LB-8]|uniref:DUF4270 domain-containing protein n=1 Tax=Paraflavisolibacter caeni TaxID=2982496 RepID=A0A9X2XSK1_9BACT|nr:DUF4270 family protein [Paraflavisolibacter caeni]MCU7548329.1 DUF4270 domain-containing protein [Paraflavisolibacter caeni]